MMNTQALEKLGIDTEEGLANCADDEEFFEEMLVEFAREGDENLACLRTFLEGEDWANYRIRAHSLKNTARMVGALALSEQAYSSERAAADSDASVIRALHAPLVARYRELLDGIRQAIG